MSEDKNLLDILFDRDNDDTIVLYDEYDQEVEFEQVAVIPYKTRKGRNIYAVLRPLTKREGLDNDKVQIFRVDEDDDGEPMLCVEEDEKLRKRVYIKYLELLDKGE